MLNNIKIHRATINDVPLILSFIKQLAQHEGRANEVVANEENLKQALFGDKKNIECIISYVNEQAIGFALFFYTFSTYLGKSNIYLEDIFVLPEFRKSGVGRKMLVYLANIAKQHGCERLEFSVLENNHAAINFYKRLGAKAKDNVKLFVINDQIIAELSQAEQLIF